MAPAGPPSDPPDRPDDPRSREVSDWDWGGDWDDPAGDDALGTDRQRAARGDSAAGPQDRRGGQADRASGRGGRTGRGRSSDGRDADGHGPRGDRPDDRDADHRSRRSGAAATGDLDPDDAAPHPALDAPRTRPATLSSTVVRRRRATAVGGGVVALLLVVLGATAIAGGGGDDDPQAPKADGGQLQNLTGVAARASSDMLERSAAVEKYARIGLPIYCGAGKKPWVALTFDDGPSPELSPKWISLMAKEGVPMTLFRIGRNIPGNEEYVRVQRNLGWDSGSHTQTHPPLASLSPKDQRDEIVKGIFASQRVLGRPPQLFRPPYESHNAQTDRIVKERGDVEVLWNVDTQDSLGGTSVDQIVETAKKGMKPGSIILMHEVKPNTLTAMPRIIAALKERNLKPVTISRMLASDGPSEAQLRKGYDGCDVDLTPGKASS
ncbi:polysaccharide deacetylase family protein [Patulibacter minatonensis]|uniref:polysaccharide deacetylase family protein n=1 Tax=Patulibacter minatonensis TaxID=298163 RepID=UPI0004AF0F8F|nr:polysaccharide deacetylase family protein [Patulibacter minatonensis]